MYRISLLLLFLIALPVTAQPDPSGDWRGEITVPGSPLGIEVTLQRVDGDWRGTISIPAQNLRNHPLAGIEVEGAAVRFHMEGIPGTPTFDGTLQDGGALLAGAFRQGGGTLTFRLQRADAARDAMRAEASEALDGFDAFVRQAMEDWGVPGAAVAIVKGDEAVFLEGFGMRDVESGLPVTPQTLFAIGSATKAFTAAALGTLADEGRLDWEEPVTTYLPDFRLADATATEQMTTVDLLTHRSGLPRYDLLWYYSPYDRAELYQRLRHLEPNRPFRSAWQYQNLMYLTAGVLTERITGQSWEEAVRERLLDPLGMTTATFTVEAMQERPDFAQPYGGSRDSTERIPFYSRPDLGPAGLIHASAAEMTAWLRLNLANGSLDGREILSAGTVGRLHAPQVVVSGQQPLTEAPYLLYALGWFVEPYRGHRMLQHGGNINGFSALVGFLPDEEVGVVVLTNKNGSPLPRLVMLTAFDRLLGATPRDWHGESIARAREAASGLEAGMEMDRIEGTTPVHPLTEYAGRYEHPAFGPIEIGAGDDGLTARYFSLEGPLEHLHYDTFRLFLPEIDHHMVLSFHTNVSGQVHRLTAPMEPTMDGLPFDRVAELRAEDLVALAGTYRGGGLTFTVARRGAGGLALTVTGQGTWELIPVREGVFDIQGLSGYSVRFEREGDRVVRLIAVQPNGSFPAERVE